MTLAQYIGQPYSKQFDCWALCRAVLATEFRKVVPDYSFMYDNPEDGADAAFTIWKCQRSGAWEVVKDKKPGDVLIFRIGGYDCHAGVHIGGNDFIHCLRGRQTTIESLKNGGWGQRLTGVWRWMP